jgi:hypothetical protein
LPYKLQILLTFVKLFFFRPALWRDAGIQRHAHEGICLWGHPLVVTRNQAGIQIPSRKGAPIFSPP